MTHSLSFRPATLNDCLTIAQLFVLASDGVSKYVWHTLRDQYPGLSLLEIGAARYANPDTLLSYKNCTIAEWDGQTAGMLLTFPTAPAADTEISAISTISAEMPSHSAIAPSLASATSASPSEPSHEPANQEPDVLAPYSLEAPNTWYICALAIFPPFQKQGIGSQFLRLTHQQAAHHGFSKLSLLCFEQNAGAKRLYQRSGFEVIDRVAVVPHPFIHHTGDLLLMTAPVQL